MIVSRSDDSCSVRRPRVSSKYRGYSRRRRERFFFARCGVYASRTRPALLCCFLWLGCCCTRWQTLVLKVVRIFLLGVLSVSPRADATTPASPGKRALGVVPPCVPPRVTPEVPKTAVAPENMTAGSAAEVAVAATGVAAVSSGDKAADIPTTSTMRNVAGSSTENVLDAEMSPAAAAAAAAAAALIDDATVGSDGGPQPSTVEAALPGDSDGPVGSVTADAPAAGQSVVEGTVRVAADASLTLSGLRGREQSAAYRDGRARLWACLPRDVTDAVLGAVEVSEFQVSFGLVGATGLENRKNGRLRWMWPALARMAVINWLSFVVAIANALQRASWRLLVLIVPCSFFNSRVHAQRLQLP